MPRRRTIAAVLAAAVALVAVVVVALVLVVVVLVALTGRGPNTDDVREVATFAADGRDPGGQDLTLVAAKGDPEP